MSKKLSPRKAEAIRGLLRAGVSVAGVARAFKVSASTVIAVRDGKTWKRTDEPEVRIKPIKRWKSIDKWRHPDLRSLPVMDREAMEPPADDQQRRDRRRKIAPREIGCPFKQGEDHPGAKLTARKVLAIRGLIAKGISVKGIARSFGVSASAIRNIRDRVTWKHLTDPTPRLPIGRGRWGYVVMPAQDRDAPQEENEKSKLNP